MQINNNDVKNILLVRNDRFGEFLLNIPAIRAVRETFSNAKLILVVSPDTRELAECLTFIDEIIEWRQGRHPFLEKIRLLRRLRNKRIDIAVMLNSSQDFNLFSFLAGIPVRAGYDRKCGFLLTHKLKDKKYLEERHEIEYNLQLVGLTGARTGAVDLSLTLGAYSGSELVKSFLSENKDFIALHPFTSDAVKQWPVDNFRELAEEITGKLMVKVLIIGGKDEEAKSLELFNNTNKKITNLTGKTSLKDLALILNKSKLLISGDSGPVHLACAVNTKVIALFRNDLAGKTPKRWGPWGAGNRVIEKNNLSDITVQEVFGITKEALS